MKFKSIEEHIEEVDHKIPVSVCLDKPDAERWEVVKQKLKRINERAKIADFARKALNAMLNDLERLIKDHETEHGRV